MDVIHVIGDENKYMFAHKAMCNISSYNRQNRDSNLLRIKDLYQFDNYFPIFDSAENSFPIIIYFPSWERSQSIGLITFGEHRIRKPKWISSSLRRVQSTLNIPPSRPGQAAAHSHNWHGMTNMVSLSWYKNRPTKAIRMATPKHLMTNSNEKTF